jgi:hypothetical protein
MHYGSENCCGANVDVTISTSMIHMEVDLIRIQCGCDLDVIGVSHGFDVEVQFMCGGLNVNVV